MSGIQSPGVILVSEHPRVLKRAHTTSWSEGTYEGDTILSSELRKLGIVSGWNLITLYNLTILRESLRFVATGLFGLISNVQLDLTRDFGCRRARRIKGGLTPC